MFVIIMIVYVYKIMENQLLYQLLIICLYSWSANAWSQNKDLCSVYGITNPHID